MMNNTKKYMNIPMNIDLYSRKNCNELADTIYETRQIEGMTKDQLAVEIFAHAYIFYNFRFVPAFLRKTAKAQSFYRSVENGVDLEDNGDTLVRRIAYRFIWMLPAFKTSVA